MWEIFASPSDVLVGILSALVLAATLGLVRLAERIREIGS